MSGLNRKNLLAVLALSTIMSGVLLPVKALHADDSVSRQKLMKAYSDFAGSKANTESLVSGLRSGHEVTLISAIETVKFTPPARTIGLGNVDMALAMARAELAGLGITNPLPSQIQAALMGGDVTTSSGSKALVGILIERAHGKGWGPLADSLGIKIRDLKRSDTFAEQTNPRVKARDAAIIERAERAESLVDADRVEHAADTDSPERVEQHNK